MLLSVTAAVPRPLARARSLDDAVGPPLGQLWANVSVMMRFWGGDAQLGVTSLPRQGGAAAANFVNSRAAEIAGRTASGSRAGQANGGGGGGGSGWRSEHERGSEFYGMTRRDIRALLGKLEAHSPGAQGLQQIYDQVTGPNGDRIVDIWKAPPIPVICVVGAGSETHIEYGYREPWPRNMAEEPCPLRAEDGDSTVPVRSIQSICSHWQRQKRCHAPLSAASQGVYKARTGDCVETVMMHCKAANMESVDIPRGADHCYFYHARILHKKPVLDLVHAIAVNPDAFEPGFAPNLGQLHELMQLVAWLHTSAERRLPSESDLLALHRKGGASSSVSSSSGGKEGKAAATDRLGGARSGGATGDSPGRITSSSSSSSGSSGSSSSSGHGILSTAARSDEDAEAAISRIAERMRQAVYVLRSRPAFERLLESLKLLGGAAKRRVRAAAAVAANDPPNANGEGVDPCSAEAAAAEEAVASALETAREALSPVADAAKALGVTLEEMTKGCALEPKRQTAKPQPYEGGANGNLDEHAFAMDGGLCADASADSSGLPGFDWTAYESASHSSLRASTDTCEVERQLALSKRRAMCRLQRALEGVQLDLREVKEHADFVQLHWKGLAEQLQRPEPAPNIRPPGDARSREGTPPSEGMESYVSALYDNLGSEADDVSRH